MILISNNSNYYLGSVPLDEYNSVVQELTRMIVDEKSEVELADYLLYYVQDRELILNKLLPEIYALWNP